MIIETIRLVYGELFSVNFIHDRYSASNSSVTDDIVLKPDTATKALFDNHGISYRMINNRLLCFVRATSSNPPDRDPMTAYQALPGDLHIRFFMNANTRFMNNTAIKAAGVDEVYRFSNTSTPDGVITQDVEAGDNDLEDVAVVEAEERCLAVIDITRTNVNGVHDLFAADEILQHPVYSIRFHPKT